MVDFVARRTTMVDTQVRPSDVTKYPIIDAMLSVPREEFVPVNRREVAYADTHIDLGGNRVVLDPRTLAKMLEAADIQPDDLVLDIGCGLGYSAALAAHMAEAVVAVEEPEWAKEAEATLAEANVDNVAVVEGVLTGGAPKHGPYDVVMFQGAVTDVPDTLIEQVKDGGRLVAIFADGALGTVRVGYKIDGVANWRFAFNASAPMLPGFEREKAFVL